MSSAMREKSTSTKRKNDDYEEDDFLVEDDDVPKRKEGKDAKKVKTSSGDEMYDIGGKKKLTVGNYKGNLLINIREYYEDKKSGEEKVSFYNENVLYYMQGMFF